MPCSTTVCSIGNTRLLSCSLYTVLLMLEKILRPPSFKAVYIRYICIYWYFTPSIFFSLSLFVFSYQTFLVIFFACNFLVQLITNFSSFGHQSLEWPLSCHHHDTSSCTHGFLSNLIDLTPLLSRSSVRYFLSFLIVKTAWSSLYCHLLNSHYSVLATLSPWNWHAHSHYQYI